MPNEDDDDAKPVTVGMMRDIGINLMDRDQKSLLNVFFINTIAAMKAVHASKAQTLQSKAVVWIGIVSAIIAAIAAAVGLVGGHK